MAEPLLIVGASTRAAAFSALRAGLAPSCIDYFADVDLQRRCQVARAHSYPQSLPKLARQVPASPWMYTGALENYPRLIDKLTGQRCLYGNTGAVVRRVRNPAALAQALVKGPCRFPAWQATAAGLPRDGSWLRKRYRSAGGTHVQSWVEDNPLPEQEPGWYFQQRASGLACAALYVAAGGQARLLGLTEQLVGAAWTGATGFRYAGSLGPLNLPAIQQAALEQLGDVLARDFGLVGIFGVDLVLSSTDVWLIEVNPRFPASAEVLERALGFSAVGLHVDACQRHCLPESVPSNPDRWYGKAIIFSTNDLLISTTAANQLEAASLGDWPAIADIPSAGTKTRTRWPIMTVLAEAADRSALIRSLQKDIGFWQSVFQQ